MSKIGACAVHVRDEHGDLHAFLPGDEPPAWAAKLMGRHCFVGAAPISEPAPEVSRPSASTPAVGGEPPPLAGAGAGRDVWSEYAAQHGVSVDDEWKRGQIIDACRNAGIPVE